MEDSESNDEWYAYIKDTKELRNVLNGFENEFWNYVDILEWLKVEMEKMLKLKESWVEDNKTIPIIPNDEKRASELETSSVINLLKFFQFQPPDTNKSEHQEYWTIPKEFFDEDPTGPTGKPIIWSKCFFITEILEDEMEDIIFDFHAEDEDITSRVGNAPVRKKLINITKCKNCMKTYKSIMQHLNKESKCKLIYSDMDMHDLKEKVKANSEEKARERMKIHYKNNRDEILKQRQSYHKQNHAKIRTRKIDYYHKNRSKVNQQNSDYYHRNIKDITEKRKIKEKQIINDAQMKCKDCGKLFYQAVDLGRHIRAIHGVSSSMEHLRTMRSKYLEKYKKAEDGSDFDIDKATEKKVAEEDAVQSLVRKKKAIDFTMEDLEADKEDEDDSDFDMDKDYKN